MTKLNFKQYGHCFTADHVGTLVDKQFEPNPNYEYGDAVGTYFITSADVEEPTRFIILRLNECVTDTISDYVLTNDPSEKSPYAYSRASDGTVLCYVPNYNRVESSQVYITSDIQSHFNDPKGFIDKLLEVKDYSTNVYMLASVNLIDDSALSIEMEIRTMEDDADGDTDIFCAHKILSFKANTAEDHKYKRSDSPTVKGAHNWITLWSKLHTVEFNETGFTHVIPVCEFYRTFETMLSDKLEDLAKEGFDNLFIKTVYGMLCGADWSTDTHTLRIGSQSYTTADLKTHVLTLYDSIFNTFVVLIRCKLDHGV